MLDHLRVRNLGVLQDASVEPSPGFTVITGETGAGKTLLLGGLRLLLGEQADANAVGPHGDEAQVDGLLSDGAEELGVSRVIPGKGRSRAYLEGSVVSAAALGGRVGARVEVVGQHDQLTITKRSHVLGIVDAQLEDERPKANYLASWKRLQEALARQEMLGGGLTELRRELDLARYQADEIARAGLTEGDDEAHESELGRLRNVAEIRELLAMSLRHVESMSESAGELVASLRKVAALDATVGELTRAGEMLAESLAEIGRDLRNTSDEVVDDPLRREELEQRLNEIGDLKRKYGRTLEEVLSHGERMKAKTDELDMLLDQADEIEGLVARRRREVSELASELTAARAKAARALGEQTLSHLTDLGLGSATIEITLEPVDPGPNGADVARLLFASDRRLESGPVGDVASGGELSRIVLALRLAARDRTIETMVFDEVDTGIGGATALAMGEKLADLAAESQVLCVTHLAQVAAFADTHYVLERDGVGVARALRVEGPERLAELSRMLAGQPESESGQSAAAELLALATEHR